MHVHYPEISKKFPCKDCDAMFHDRSKLKLHAMKHSNIKPFVCEQCGKGFNWIASFQDHMDMHGGVKKYSCEFCQRQFTKRNTLNNHRRLHTGEKPFMCPSPGCGMTFVQVSHLSCIWFWIWHTILQSDPCSANGVQDSCKETAQHWNNNVHTKPWGS